MWTASPVRLPVSCTFLRTTKQNSSQWPSVIGYQKKEKEKKKRNLDRTWFYAAVDDCKLRCERGSPKLTQMSVCLKG